jgi:hypothetical protein
MASAVMSLIIASQILGDMTPQEIAEAAAIALVEKGGFHRRQYC